MDLEIEVKRKSCHKYSRKRTSKINSYAEKVKRGEVRRNSKGQIIGFK